MMFLVVLVSYAQKKPEQLAKTYHPLVPDHLADPSIVKFGDTFYLYATTDIDKELKQAGPPVVWKSKDFINWSFEGALLFSPAIDWGKEYAFNDKDGKSKTGYFRYWAPGRVIKKGDKYYLYVTIVKPNDELGTYVLTAIKPEGPFNFTNGEGVFFNDNDKNKIESKPLLPDIDGEPFIDDDGKSYIVWRRRMAAALNDDLVSLKGASTTLPTKFGGYSEGPVLFKRKNIYYYVYTLSGGSKYHNGYMMSKDGPLGKFENPIGANIITFSDTTKNIWGPGHGNVFQMPGTDDFYFTYLEYGEGSTTRQVFVNRMEFNTDGTIKPIMVDGLGVGNLIDKKIKGKENLALHSIINSSSVTKERFVKADFITNPDNDAKGRVTKSDRTFTYEAKNAADGSNGTRWLAKLDDSNPWITYDLKSGKKINRMDIFFVKPAYGHAFKVEKSNDGLNWTLVQQQDDQLVKSPQTVNGIGKTRYLKVTILKGTPGIWETKIY